MLRKKRSIFKFFIVLITLFVSQTNFSFGFIGNAQSGINETFAILYLGGGPSNTFYDLYATTSNADFNNANLGTFNCNGTLILKGGQTKVFKCSGGDITNSEIFYRIYKTGSTPSAFSSIGIGYLSGFGNGCGGADQTWETANSTVNVLSGLSAGNYQLELYTRAGTINNGPTGYWYASNGGANYIANFTVDAPVISAFATQALCFGQTGTIVFTATGGTAPLSFTKNGVAASSPITALTGGTYTINATDANGCTGQTILGIAPIPTQVLLSATLINGLCDGLLGQINFTTSGGTGAKTVTWLGSAVTSPMINLFGFGYVLVATDAYGCSNATTVTIVDPVPISLIITPTNALCNGQNGQINGSYSGGVGALTFTVNGAPYTSNYPAGVYTCMVTDANACSVSDVVTIGQPLPFNVAFNLANNTSFTSGATMNLVAADFGGGGPIASSVFTGPNAFNSTSNVYNTTVGVINAGIYSISVANAAGCTATSTVNIIVSAPLGITLSAKLFLDGPYQSSNGMMHDSLRLLNLIPSIEPYSAAPFNTAFTHIGGGAETVSSAVLAAAGTNAIVDWVFVEIRSAANPANVVATKAALLQRDGDVVSAADGTSALNIMIPNDNYFIAISHRNHLGVMTAAALPLSSANTTIDFTNTATAIYLKPMPNSNATPLSGATKIVSGKRTLYAGNCNLLGGSKTTISCGNSSISDRKALLTATNGTNLPNGYSIFDVDMNGTIRFNGFNTDREVIQKTCANNNTNIIVHQQLP
jgi:SprB repeat